MIEAFENMLTGGHPNSLGRTVEVVDAVLAEPARIHELLDTYTSSNDVVRLRVSSAFKRIEQANQPLMLQHLDAFLDRVIDLPAVGAQPSAQWTVAQLCQAVSTHLRPDQYGRAKTHMQRNLETMNDWIVLAQTMTTLTAWSKDDMPLRTWLHPRLELRTKDSRVSVAKRATKCLAALSKLPQKSEI